MSAARDRLATLVDATAIFGALSEDARSAVVDALEVRDVRRGSTIIHQGARADGLYIVDRGRLRVELVEDDGSRTVLGEVGRGEVAGEMALITDGPRSADVVAIRDSRLAFLPLAAFDALVAEHAGAMRAVSTVLIRKLVATAHGRRGTAAGATVVVVPITDTERTRRAVTALREALVATIGGVHSGSGDDARAETGDDADAAALQEWCELASAGIGGAVLEADAEYTPWTDAWLEPGAPAPLPMPLQSALVGDAQRRIHRVAHKEGSGARQLATYFVGQVVGQMNRPMPARRVVTEMIEEFASAMERMNTLVGDE